MAVPIEIPPPNWLAVFPWEERDNNIYFGRFRYGDLYYFVNLTEDTYLSPTTDGDVYGTYSDADPLQFFGDRKTGHLWGPWEGYSHEYKWESDAEARVKALENYPPDHEERKVYNPNFFETPSGGWRVEWEERPLVAEHLGPANWEGHGHFRYWIPPDDLTDMLADMGQYPNAIKVASDTWHRLEGFNSDWVYMNIDAKVCYDAWCDELVGEDSLGGVEMNTSLNANNDDFWVQVSEVLAEAAHPAVQRERIQPRESEMVESKEIPRDLASTLRFVSYVGTPGTVELGRVVRAANNDEAADAQDILIAGTALINMADELAAGAVSKGMSAPAARRQYKWMRQAGVQLLTLLR